MRSATVSNRHFSLTLVPFATPTLPSGSAIVLSAARSESPASVHGEGDAGEAAGKATKENSWKQRGDKGVAQIEVGY